MRLSVRATTLLRATLFASLVTLFLAGTVSAELQLPITIVPGELPCLPLNEQAPVTARVDPEPEPDPSKEPEGSVRIYFRRLSIEVEDFYWIEMTRASAGNYWAVLPLPESAKIDRKELASAVSSRRAAWWKAKEASDHRNPTGDLDQDVIKERAAVGKLERRDWLPTLENATFETWLAEQKYEPAEWFIAVVDEEGKMLTRSPMAVAPVDPDCKAALTREQKDAANELDIGDTSAWQEGDQPFHWECEHISKRIDIDGEEDTQVCPVAIIWWPVAGTLGALGAIIVLDDDDPETSVSRP